MCLTFLRNTLCSDANSGHLLLILIENLNERTMGKRYMSWEFNVRRIL